MKLYPKAVLFLLLVMLLSASGVGWCRVPVQDGDAGTIGACLTQPDGSWIALPCEEVIKAGRSGKSFAIKEWFEPHPQQPRLAVISTRPLPVKEYWNVDVTGILSTLSGVSRSGKEITQRVLIVSPENVTVYCSRNGRPLTFLPIKGLDIDWPYKRTLADLANDSVAETASISTIDEGSLPSMPDFLDSASAPVYCGTIADARAQYSATERMLVELQCRPFSGVTSTQFTLGQDSPTDSITVNYTNSASLSTGRINKIVGTIQKDAGNNYWIEVDSGPNWTEGDFLGSIQAVPEGSITWAKTFADTTTLPAPLSGKVISRTFPSLGYFYIQETSRASGIRVNDFSMASFVRTGDIVNVEGDLSTDDGERVINASYTTLVDATTITAIGMNNRSLAGGGYNLLTPGACEAFGLNNVGLLVRAWGKVTAVGSDYFYLDDGSNCDDGSGSGGVRVVNVSGYMPSTDDYVAVTGVSGLATYDTDLARTIRLANSSDLSGICPPLPPANLTVVSTGSGKITLYWDGVPGADGYNVYRGTNSGGENYTTPVNGGTPVTTESYSGSGIYTFTNTGLTNGTEYFYTVKAVADCGESQPSNEDSDVADPAGIPWDSSNPSDVLNAVRAAYANDPPQGSLRVAGPDGRIYEDGQSTVLPPDGTWIPGTNQIILADGTRMSLPEVPESPGDSAMFGGDIEPLIPATTLPQHLGPYRRLRTVASYTGVRGSFYLPLAGDGNKASAEDDIYILLGSSGTGEVDAGLQWSQNLETGQKNGFNPYMLTYPRNRPIINVPTSPRFTFDQLVEVTYRSRTTYPRQSKAVSLITIHSDDQGLTRDYGAYSVYKPNEAVRVKRMHSIAQPRQGARRTGSYIQRVAWRSGQVRTTSGSWTSWTNAITNENGSNPAKGSIVNWFETSPYVSEDNIKIDLR